MDINKLPDYEFDDNPTGCCPRFDPEGWDGQDLHFKDKLFVRAKTRSLVHIPLNMGSVFKKTFEKIDHADAQDNDDFVVLSHEQSAWSAEHLFAVTKPVEDCEVVNLSGDFVTKVFEGPFREMRHWCQNMAETVEQDGEQIENMWFFYTTCPKCAKAYGKNYVVGIAQIN